MTISSGEARPVFDHFPRRSRLLEHLAHKGAILMSAPSGWGKTVLASHITDAASDAIWFGCSGEAANEALWGAIRESVRCRPSEDEGSHHSGQSSPCLVLDDLALPDARAISELRSLRAALTESGWRLIVTSRSAGVTDIASEHGFHVLDRHDLAFTPYEAVDLWTDSAASATENHVDAVLASCGGHAALLGHLLKSGGRVDIACHGEAAMQLIDRLVRKQLATHELHVLLHVALMGHGMAREVDTACHEDIVDTLLAVEAAIPFVALSVDRSCLTQVRFVAHDLLFDWALARLRGKVFSLPGAAIDDIVLKLAAKDELRRAFAIALGVGLTHLYSSLLSANGAAALTRGMADSVEAMLCEMPLADPMTDPQLMLLWSEALLDLGRPEDALGKARAARMLAEHVGQTSVAAVAGRRCAGALFDLNQWDEAQAELTRILARGVYRDDPEGEARLRTGLILGHLFDGDNESALRELAQIDALLGRRKRPDDVVLAAGAVQALAIGDFTTAARTLAPLASMEGVPPTERIIRKGNLAALLTETGRLDRALALQDSIELGANADQLGPCLQTRGAILAGFGESDAVATVERAIRYCVDSRNESSAAQARIFLAVILRAEGLASEALVAAERAYERLCVADSLRFSRLAALEVGASLLALGDARAARAWAEPVGAEKECSMNHHHAMRAAMVLAECDRVDGVDAEHRFIPLVGHVRSGNSNWQIALYCRAFPALLGTLASTVGVEELPAHMLRMIPPEHAEKCLGAARPALSKQAWLALGSRMLGGDQMDAFVVRGGEPVCHVRLFGGLDVNIDGRTIREKDWRKRKSRLLFVMLVARRGQDVSRDQIFEHLWPDFDEDKAKNNFYVIWSMMKGALMGGSNSGPCPYIESSRGRCRIVREAVRSDVDDFEEALAVAKRAENEGNLERAVSSFERVSSLYRGELLPGDVFDDWFAPLRDHYRYQFIDAMIRATELLLEHDKPCEALIYVRRGISVDKSREDLYQLALRAHIAAGQRSAAIETFVQCKYQLSEELGLDPSGETLRLYADILAMEQRPRYDSFGLDAAPSAGGDIW